LYLKGSSTSFFTSTSSSEKWISFYSIDFFFFFSVVMAL
jgi:hypothetical protein